MKLLSVLVLPALAFAAEPISNIPLVNQDGKPFQLYDLKGKYVLTSFVYSRCPLPKMCPLTMSLSRRALEAWHKAKDLKGKELHILMVTLDPMYDTAAVLKKWGQSHHADFKKFTLATGDPKVLDTFQSSFNVVAFPDHGMIAHNMKTILIGPDMVELKQFKENEWKPEDIVKAVQEKK